MVRQQVHAIGRARALRRAPPVELREIGLRAEPGVRPELPGEDVDQRVERRGPLPCLVARSAHTRDPARLVVDLVAELLGPHLADPAGQPRPGLGQAPGCRRAPHEVDRAADLGPVEEPDAADLVREPGPGQPGLDRRQLGVHPQQHGDLRGRHATGHPRPDPGDQRGQLGRLGLVALDGRRRPVRPGRVEMLGPPARREELIRELEHLRTRAVVLRQRDHARARVALGEPGQELAGRARERVDRLVLVADDAQVGAVAQPQLEQPLLERVGVLVFVDADPALARAHGLQRVGVGLEQVDRLDQQVVEVDPPGARLGTLVVGEDLDEEVGRDRRLAPGGRGGPLVGRRRRAPALRPFDLVGQVLDGREPVVAGEAAGDRHEQRHLRVEDVGEWRAFVPARPEVLELAEGVGVEGPRGHPGQAERAQPVDHLARGLVGEGDDQGLVDLDGTGADGVRRPPADDPGLAGPGGGKDGDGAFDGEDRLALRLVQVVEQPRGVKVLRVLRCGRHPSSMTAPARLPVTTARRCPAGGAAGPGVGARYARSVGGRRLPSRCTSAAYASPGPSGAIVPGGIGSSRRRPAYASDMNTAGEAAAGGRSCTNAPRGGPRHSGVPSAKTLRSAI